MQKSPKLERTRKHKESIIIVESLELLLGFKFDEKELKKFDESVKEINKSLVALGATVIASATAITAMTLSSSRGAVDMLKLSSATGTAVANLEALEYISAQNSIATSTLSGALESVRNNIAGISKGGGSAIEAFSMLGISAFGADGKLRDSYETMQEATQKLSEMKDETRKADYAQQIFGGSASEMMLMIRKGSQAFKDGELAMKKYGSAVPKEELENIAKFSQSWDVLANSFNSFTQLVWGKLAPSMNTLIEGLLKWWEINKAIVTENAIRYYKAFTNTIQIIVKWFWELTKIVSRAVDALGGFERVLKLTLYAFTAIMAMKFLSFLGSLIMMAKTVGTAMMAMNLKIMLIPIMIGAMVVMAGLIIEDFVGMLTGKNSVIEDIIGKEWSDSIRKGFTEFGKTINETSAYWIENGIGGGLAKGFKALWFIFDDFAEKVDQWFIKWAISIAEKIANGVKKAFKDAMDFLTPDADNQLVNGFMSGVDRTLNVFGKNEDKANSNIGNSYQSSNQVMTQNNNPIFNINSQGSIMPERIATGIQNEFNQTFSGYSHNVR